MLGEIILSKYSVTRVVQCIGVGLGATTAAVFLTEVTKFSFLWKFGFLWWFCVGTVILSTMWKRKQYCCHYSTLQSKVEHRRDTRSFDQGHFQYGKESHCKATVTGEHSEDARSTERRQHDLKLGRAALLLRPLHLAAQVGALHLAQHPLHLHLAAQRPLPLPRLCRPLLPRLPPPRASAWVAAVAGSTFSPWGFRFVTIGLKGQGSPCGG